MAKPTSKTPLKPVVTQASPELSAGKWYGILGDFFRSVGLFETQRGFEADLLVLSRAQHERLPKALQTLSEEVCCAVEGRLTIRWGSVILGGRKIMKSCMLRG